MFTRRAVLMRATFVVASPHVIRPAHAQETAANAGALPVDLSAMPRRKAKLVAPPFVHPQDQVATTGPEIVEFEITIVEKEIHVDEDAWLQAVTFNGSVPGPMVVVHEGDYVELTLFNPPENMLQHNIDFHVATGALGGAALTLVNPGEKAVLRFKATRPGGVCLSPCAGLPDDSVACGVRHVGLHHGDAFDAAANGDDPLRRWIASYRREVERRGAADLELHTLGCFGVNDVGVADIAGNIGDWTDSCFQSGTVASDGSVIETRSDICVCARCRTSIAAL